MASLQTNFHPLSSSTAELQAKREEEQCSELETIQELIVCLAVLAIIALTPFLPEEWGCPLA